MRLQRIFSQGDRKQTTPRLSVVVIGYNMRRALRRTLVSLSPAYQNGMECGDYEIILIENGSDDPLSSEELASHQTYMRYRNLQNPPPSPAHAINQGVSLARGELICIMVDGAHMVTPGMLTTVLPVFRAFEKPVVLAPRFYLGPGPQSQTMFAGYDEAEEDRLLEGIGWPGDGYRLFEIGYPFRVRSKKGARRPFWFARLFESNCMFMRKSTFEELGGCDLRFDLPGGGFLMPDLYRQLMRLPGTDAVQLIGEASFHQLHGGISTNADIQDQRAQAQRYRTQYRQIRGEEFTLPEAPVHFYGHLPNWRAMTLILED